MEGSGRICEHRGMAPILLRRGVVLAAGLLACGGPVGRSAPAGDESSTGPEAEDVPDLGSVPAEPQAPSPEVPPDLPSQGAGHSSPAPCPDLPEGFASYLVGDPTDAEVDPVGPAWMLAGGMPSPPDAIAWWSSHAAGGDVVMLRTEPVDNYLDLFEQHAADVDSIEILAIQSPEDAVLEAVTCRLEQAEAIFVLGGWQNTYVDNWSASPIPGILEKAWARGAAIGGNSAGIAIMGEYVFGAHQGTIQSAEALADPYSPKITLDTDFLEMPLGRGILFETHFYERDRMGRSIAFLARIIEAGWEETPIVVAVDEDTALLVDHGGLAQVRGTGSVYVLRPPGPASVCAPKAPLVFEDVQVFELADGEQLWLPDGITDIAPLAVTAADGELDPPDPY